MVIVCPECSTKFRVNPERIPAGGTKVLCARCKHIFLAEKPAPVEEPQPLKLAPEPEAVTEPPSPEPEGAAEPTTEAAAEPEAEVVSEPDLSSEPELAAPAVEEQTTEETPAVEEPVAEATEEESGFSYDQFRELDATPEAEDFSFSAAAEEEPQEELPAEETAEVEQDNFSFAGEEPQAAATPNEESPTEVPPETVVEPPASQVATGGSSITRILLLLILGLAIIGGALYFINGPEAIEQAVEQIFGQQSRPSAAGKITLTNLEGKFINNQEAGELFVIRGQATNNFSEARAAIQVKGVIFDQNGKPLLQKTIFCGNPINDQELQTLPFAKLEEMMRNQFGKSLDNMKVNSKEAIPFVIAFRDLPKNLAEFSVDVAASEPVAK